jgi:hypothetical protein
MSLASGVNISERIHALPMGLGNRLLGFIAARIIQGCVTADELAEYLDGLEAEQGHGK